MYVCSSQRFTGRSDGHDVFMAVFQQSRLGKRSPWIFHSRQNPRTLKPPRQPSHQEYPSRTRRGLPMCETVRIRTGSHAVLSSRRVEPRHHASFTLPGRRLRSFPRKRHHPRLPLRLPEQRQRLAPQLIGPRPPLRPLSGLSVPFVGVVVLYADQREPVHGAVSSFSVVKGVGDGAVLIYVWFSFMKRLVQNSAILSVIKVVFMMGFIEYRVRAAGSVTKGKRGA